MPDNKLTDKRDFFSLNNMDINEAYAFTVGARGGGKIFFLKQLCSKLKEENNRLQADNEDLRTENRILSQKRANIFEITSAYERGQRAAYIDCIKKAKEQCSKIPPYHFNLLNVEECLDKILKEMVGEENFSGG